MRKKRVLIEYSHAHKLRAYDRVWLISIFDFSPASEGSILMCLELVYPVSVERSQPLPILNILQSPHFSDLQGVDAKDRVYRMP
jgi:hypothetical protein